MIAAARTDLGNSQALHCNVINAVSCSVLHLFPTVRLYQPSLACRYRHIFLKDGDIIFRRGMDVVSQLVLMSESTTNFSHVGLVIINGDLVNIIHAVPSDAENGADQVKVESLKSFMSPEKASAIRVMRLQSVANRSLRIVQALAFAKRQIGKGFVFDLDASDDGKFYCTELVDKAYLAGLATWVR